MREPGGGLVFFLTRAWFARAGSGKLEAKAIGPGRQVHEPGRVGPLLSHLERRRVSRRCDHIRTSVGDSTPVRSVHPRQDKPPSWKWVGLTAGAWRLWPTRRFHEWQHEGVATLFISIRNPSVPPDVQFARWVGRNCRSRGRNNRVGPDCVGNPVVHPEHTLALRHSSTSTGRPEGQSARI